MTKFIQALFDLKLVPPDSLKQMTTMSDREGMGMEPFSFAGKTLYGHTGGSANSGAWLAYFPDEKLGLAYTLSKIMSNADDKRDIIPNTYDDTWYWAVSRLNRTHVFNFHYIYDLPFLRNSTSVLGKIAGGWQVSGVTFFQSGEPLSVMRGDDIAGAGDTNAQPWGLVAGQEPTLSRGDRGFSQGPSVDEIYWFNKAAFVRPANGTFGNAPRNLIRGPGFQTWDIALLKNFNFDNSRRLQFRAEFFNFPNHPNLNNPNTDPTSADFGRALAKSGERNIQLGVKLYF